MFPPLQPRENHYDEFLEKNLSRWPTTIPSALSGPFQCQFESPSTLYSRNFSTYDNIIICHIYLETYMDSIVGDYSCPSLELSTRLAQSQFFFGFGMMVRVGKSPNGSIMMRSSHAVARHNNYKG